LRITAGRARSRPPRRFASNRPTISTPALSRAVQQRPGPGDHRPLPRTDAVAAHHDLGGAGGDHPGQGPAGKRQRPVDRAGRQHDAPAVHRQRFPPALGVHPVGGDVPDRRAGDEPGAVHRFDQLVAGVVAGRLEPRVETLHANRELTEDLPAGPLGLVDDHRFDTGRSQLAGRRQPRRSTADDHDVRPDLGHGASGPQERTCRPSSTSTMQERTATSSM
jgi:hypothetical protein